MKQSFIFLIVIYQKFISPIVHQLLGIKNACRYSVTCSEYAKQSIAEYGILRGGVLSVKRLLTCQPFSKSYGYL
jgi:uncharacterized protein